MIFLISFIVVVMLLSLEVLLSGFFSKKALKEENEHQYNISYRISPCKSSKIFNIITIVLILIITIGFDINILLDDSIRNILILISNSFIIAILIAHLFRYFKNLNLYYVVNDTNIERHTKKEFISIEYNNLSYTVCNYGILLKDNVSSNYYLIPDNFVGVNHLRKLLVSKEVSNISIDEIKKIIESYDW